MADAALHDSGLRPTIRSQAAPNGTVKQHERGLSQVSVIRVPLNVVTGQLTTRLLEQPARSTAKTGQSKQQRLQVAVAAHLRDIARADPASTYREVVITIDMRPSIVAP